MAKDFANDPNKKDLGENMIRRMVYTLTCWMMILGLCHGQGTFEPTPHWNADRRDNLFKDGEIVEWDENNYPVGWDDVTAFESGRATSIRRR